MSLHDHDVNTCYLMGHIYMSVHAVYCVHEQRWTMTVSAWEDHPSGVTHEHYRRDIDLGPFDADNDVIALGSAELQRATTAVRSMVDARD